MVDKEALVYRSGDVFLPRPLRRFLETYLIGGPTTSLYITYWSLVHLLSGILFAGVYPFFRPQAARNTILLHGFLVHTVWELWQIAIGMSHPLRLTGGGNLVDICMDTVLFMVGVWLTVSFNGNVEKALNGRR